jgi:hypothetical protein
MIKVNTNKCNKRTYIYDINYSRSEIYLAAMKYCFRLRHADIGVSIWNQHMLR